MTAQVRSETTGEAPEHRDDRHEARGRRHARLRRRPRQGLLRAASGGGSTPTSPPATASAWCSSRLRARGARSSSARASRRRRRARRRACSSSSPTSRRRAPSWSAHGVEVSEVFHDAGGVFHHAGTEGRVAGPRSGAQQLRLVRLVQRSGRQRLAAPGDHDAAARAGSIRPRRAFASAERSGAGAAACGGSARRAREADRRGRPNWPDWYAEYMVREQAGEELPT